MIKVTSEKGEVKLSIEGSLACLKTDFLFICRAMVKGIEEKNEEAAEEFRRFLAKDLDHDLDMVGEDIQKEVLQMLKKKLDDDGMESLIEVLADALKEIADEV